MLKGWLIRFLKGVIIALGFILPGVSGGVLAAILGIYERMLRFMANIREDFKGNMLFFLPVGIGGIVGLALLSNPLEYLLEHHLLLVLWGFAGATVGTIPALWKESTRGGARDKVDISWLVGSAVIGFLFLYFLGDIFGTVPGNFAGFVLAGILLALGILLPGLSPSNLLLVLGLYDPMLKGFEHMDIGGVFLPIVIGGVTTVLLFSKLMNKLIQTKSNRVYHFVVGIVIASTALILLPPVADYSGASVFVLVISGILFVLGYGLGAWMSKLEERYK